ncbi:MAG: Gfo/Idh/MocA family protein [Opitutia bacterium]
MPRLPLLALLLGLSLRAADPSAEPPRKVGIVGLDTSHAVAFTQTLNRGPKVAADAPKFAGFRVVAAYAPGSPDIASSVARVPEYTAKVRALGVEIVPSIAELCTKVDCVLLESNDGRVHLEQLRAILKARKPVFVDKPLAASLPDVLRMQAEARAAGVPMFCSSSLRFGAGTRAVQGGSLGPVRAASTFSPAHLEPTHPDLYWYGVHGCESLYAVMGVGCRTVRRGLTADGKIEVVGDWGDGRQGVFQEENGKTRKGYGGMARGPKGEAAVGTYDGYDPLLAEVVAFFRTGKAPVSDEETLELYTFMSAADESKRQNGAEVRLADVLDRACAEVARAK